MLTKSGQLIMLEAKTKPSCTACWAHNHSYYLTYPAYCMLSILPNSFKCVWFYPDWNVPIFKNIFASFFPLSPRNLALRCITFIRFLFNKHVLLFSLLLCILYFLTSFYWDFETAIAKNVVYFHRDVTAGTSLEVNRTIFVDFCSGQHFPYFLRESL